MATPINILEETGWIDFNRQQKQSGARLLALTAFRDRQIRSHWLEADGHVVSATFLFEGEHFPSLSPHLPEVAWDEREIHDLFGYIPVNHPDLRALIRTPRWPTHFHPLAADLPRTPVWEDAEPDNPAREVEGEGVTIMKVGPTHAGIIESGHFVFSIMGENVLHMDLHLFQNHRGVEAALQGLDLSLVPPLVSRICGADTVSHQANWAMAAEQLAGHQPSETLVHQRVLLLESERVLSHLNDLAQIPAGVGFQVANQRALAMKETWQRGLFSLFGHRLLFDTITPGWTATAPMADLITLIDDLNQTWRGWRTFVEGHHGFQDRMRDTGTVKRTDADRLGAQGVAGRASGLAFDARSLSPWYHDLAIHTSLDAHGDVAARFRVRLDEVEASWRLLRKLATKLSQESAQDVEWQPPQDLCGETVAFTESPHGLNVHVVGLENGKVTRYHIRPATFRNWPVLALAVSGTAVGDFPLINKSFELCYSCNDR